MTRSSYISLLVLALAAPLAACGDASIDVETARAAWRTTKASCDGAYHYTISFTSSVGAVSITQLEIVDDRTTARRFSRSFGDPNLWTETGAEVGTHEEGWPTSTMEQLHDTCARVLSEESGRSAITFRADARGVIEECSFTQKACETDCSWAFGVDAFACGSLPP